MLVIISVIGISVGAVFLLHRLLSPKKLALKGKHVLITGGSSGIGQALAVEAAKIGANVTILARNQVTLDAAKKVIERHLQDKSTQKVLAVSVDISKDYNILWSKIQQTEQELGPVAMLINCAGFSVAGRFENIPLDDFKRLMDVNYFGSVHATKAVLEGMKRNNCGRIVFISSQAGQLGIYGFTGYSASKYALRGLAESLQMEVKPYNIRVTLACPPDTDTPGYKEELKSKPKETELISETSGLFQPEQVARQIIADAQYGRFVSSIGLDGYMLSNLTSGMSPVCCIGDAVQQILTMSIFRLVSFFYLWNFDQIVRKCKEKDEASKSKTE